MKFCLVHDATKLSVRPTFQVLKPNYVEMETKRLGDFNGGSRCQLVYVCICRSHNQTLGRTNMKFCLVHDATKLSVRPTFQVLKPKYVEMDTKRLGDSNGGSRCQLVYVCICRSHNQTLGRTNMKFCLVHDATKLSVRPTFQVLKPKYVEMDTKRLGDFNGGSRCQLVYVCICRSHNQTLGRTNMKFCLVHDATKLGVRPTFQVLKPKYVEMDTKRLGDSNGGSRCQLVYVCICRSHNQTLGRTNMKFCLVHDATKLGVRPTFQVLKPKYVEMDTKRLGDSNGGSRCQLVYVCICRSHNQTLGRTNMKFCLVHDATKLSVRPTFQVLRPKYGEMRTKKMPLFRAQLWICALSTIEGS